jgi:hypothetical protein
MQIYRIVETNLDTERVLAYAGTLRMARLAARMEHRAPREHIRIEQVLVPIDRPSILNLLEHALHEVRPPLEVNRCWSLSPGGALIQVELGD